MDKFSPSALAFAIEQSKKDSKSLFELVDKNKNMDSLIRGKSKGVKHIQVTLLQPIIDKYPKFLTYLEEGERLAREASKAASEPMEVAALLRDIKEGQVRIERSVALLLDRADYTAKYVALLEAYMAARANDSENEDEQLTTD